MRNSARRAVATRQRLRLSALTPVPPRGRATHRRAATVRRYRSATPSRDRTITTASIRSGTRSRTPSSSARSCRPRARCPVSMRPRQRRQTGTGSSAMSRRGRVPYRSSIVAIGGNWPLPRSGRPAGTQSLDRRRQGPVATGRCRRSSQPMTRSTGSSRSAVLEIGPCRIPSLGRTEAGCPRRPGRQPTPRRLCHPRRHCRPRPPGTPRR